MQTFRFSFKYGEREYEGECRQVPLDGSTAMYCTPMDNALLEKFGTRVLSYGQDGKLVAQPPLSPNERAYLVAVGHGLVEYLNNVGKQE